MYMYKYIHAWLHTYNLDSDERLLGIIHVTCTFHSFLQINHYLKHRSAQQAEGKWCLLFSSTAVLTQISTKSWSEVKWSLLFSSTAMRTCCWLAPKTPGTCINIFHNFDIIISQFRYWFHFFFPPIAWDRFIFCLEFP